MNVKRRLLVYFKYLFLILSLFSLYWFIKDKDLSFLSELSIGFNFVYLLLVTGFAYTLATLGWRFSFFLEGVSFARLFLIRLCGESFALINPTNVIGGEALKAYMLKKIGVSYSDATASLVISRILVIFSLLFLLFVSFFYLSDILFLSFGLGFWELFLPLFLFLLVIVVVFYFSYRSGYVFSGLFVYLARYFGDVGWFSSLLKKLLLLDELLLKTFKASKLRLILSFLFNMFHWLFGAFEIYLILYFLGYEGVSFFDSFLIEMGVSLFKALGSFVPGQIGVEEYGNKVMLSLVSVGGVDTWLILSLLRRSRQLFWLLLGLVVFPFFISRKDISILRGV